MTVYDLRSTFFNPVYPRLRLRQIIEKVLTLTAIAFSQVLKTILLLSIICCVWALKLTLTSIAFLGKGAQKYLDSNKLSKVYKSSLQGFKEPWELLLFGVFITLVVVLLYLIVLTLAGSGIVATKLLGLFPDRKFIFPKFMSTTTYCVFYLVNKEPQNANARMPFEYYPKLVITDVPRNKEITIHDITNAGFSFKEFGQSHGFWLIRMTRKAPSGLIQRIRSNPQKYKNLTFNELVERKNCRAV